ncbi:MAG: hypothetical protein ACFFAO_14450, partial [Candidatus Hermodarchaeota archaeon]
MTYASLYTVDKFQVKSSIKSIYFFFILSFLLLIFRAFNIFTLNFIELVYTSDFRTIIATLIILVFISSIFSTFLYYIKPEEYLSLAYFKRKYRRNNSYYDYGRVSLRDCFFHPYVLEERNMFYSSFYFGISLLFLVMTYTFEIKDTFYMILISSFSILCFILFFKSYKDWKDLEYKVKLIYIKNLLIQAKNMEDYKFGDDFPHPDLKNTNIQHFIDKMNNKIWEESKIYLNNLLRYDLNSSLRLFMRSILDLGEILDYFKNQNIESCISFYEKFYNILKITNPKEWDLYYKKGFLETTDNPLFFINEFTNLIDIIIYIIKKLHLIKIFMNLGDFEYEEIIRKCNALEKFKTEIDNLRVKYNTILNRGAYNPTEVKDKDIIISAALSDYLEEIVAISVDGQKAVEIFLNKDYNHRFFTKEELISLCSSIEKRLIFLRDDLER